MGIGKGHARVKHAESGVIYEIAARNLDFQTVGFEDRQMGPEYAYEATLDHPELGELLWQVWEYPHGAENYRETNVGPHELLEDIGIDFHGPDDDYDPSMQSPARQARIDTMVTWFFERFEDPAHETPYNGREGGYQYIDGGPFNASNELQNNFPDDDFDLIEAAVEEIESDGTIDWAPKRSLDDSIDEDDLSYDSLVVEERPSRPFDLAAEAAELEALIASIPSSNQFPNFDVSDDGKVYLLTPQDAAPHPEQDPLVFALVEALEGLLNSLEGTNAHTALQAATQKYEATLTEPALSLTKLYARGVHLQCAAESTSSRITEKDLPELSPGAEAYLQTALTLHGNIMMQNFATRALIEDATAFKPPPAYQSDVLESLKKLGDEVEDVPSLVAPELREEIAEIIGDAVSEVENARATKLASITLGQVGVGLLKWVGGISAAGLVSAAVMGSGVGTAAGTAATTAVDIVTSFLVTNAASFQIALGALGTDQGWVQPAMKAFEKISQLKLISSAKADHSV